MSFLGAGYDSDGEDSTEAPEAKVQAGEPSPNSADSGGDPLADEALLKKRKIDYSKLPMSRGLSFETQRQTEHEEAPLKKAAELAANPVGQGLLAALPPPKAFSETASERNLLLPRLFLNRNKSTVPVEGLLRPDNYTDLDEEAAEVPENVFNHPMFSTDTAQPDGPSVDDLLELILSCILHDPDWYMKNQIDGGPGLLTKKRVADDVSMFDGRGWRQTTHANPNKTQKRKHQINWLATEAMEKEAEMLERGQQKILSKAQTHAKYGW
eukprot:s2451_g7.t1